MVFYFALYLALAGWGNPDRLLSPYYITTQ